MTLLESWILHFRPTLFSRPFICNGGYKRLEIDTLYFRLKLWLVYRLFSALKLRININFWVGSQKSKENDDWNRELHYVSNNSMAQSSFSEANGFSANQFSRIWMELKVLLSGLQTLATCLFSQPDECSCTPSRPISVRSFHFLTSTPRFSTLSFSSRSQN